MDIQPGIKPRTTRERLVLTGAAAASGLALLPWQIGLAAGPGAEPAPSMRRRKIPSIGESLAVVGLGSSGSFSTHDADTRADLRPIMQQFVAMGGQMVNTSGHSMTADDGQWFATMKDRNCRITPPSSTAIPGPSSR